MIVAHTVKNIENVIEKNINHNGSLLLMIKGIKKPSIKNINAINNVDKNTVLYLIFFIILPLLSNLLGFLLVS